LLLLFLLFLLLLFPLLPLLLLKFLFLLLLIFLYTPFVLLLLSIFLLFLLLLVLVLLLLFLLRPHATITMTLPFRTTNPLLLNANTAVMAKSTNFLPLLLPLAIPTTRRPHFIPRPTRFLSSLLLLTLFQHPNDHAWTCRRPVHCKLLPPPNRHSQTP